MAVYNPKSLKAEEFINNEEILATLEYAEKNKNNAELIDEIPEGEFFHITHLMEKVKARGGRVGCFPVGEKAWRDMGEWPEYLKMINVR